jgi:amidase
VTEPIEPIDPVDPVDPIDTAYAGVAGQADLLRTGAITSSDLVELLLERIDRAQPVLNPFRAVLADDARREAAAADEARRGGDSRPLLGVPIAVKDNVPVAGQRALFGTGSPEPVATADDELIRRLRAAGCIVLGLTQLPELALWTATESAHHGITRNPWSHRYVPGGSSGGSAVAVAAGLVPAAHGTDSLGSIRLPASACGLVGLKPTHGLVPMGPDPDHWHGLSHAGFLTRSVIDTAWLLDAATGSGTAYTAALREAPATLRVAASAKPSAPARVDRQVRAVLDTAVELLRRLGHDIAWQNPPYGSVGTGNTVRYLAGMAADLGNLADPGATERRSRVLAAMGRRIPHRTVERARDQGEAFAARMEDFFSRHDVLVTPTTPLLPVKAGSIVGRNVASTVAVMAPRAAYTGPWNGSGLPAVSVPIGQSGDGVPIGVQLVGPRNSESMLLALANSLEPVVGWTKRRPIEH